MHEISLSPTALESEPVSAAPTPAVAPAQAHGLQFDGETREYFRIWIVNVALSLVTLGVYSAWAKVRTERYFYGNTKLDGVPFEYLAQPIPILKGRLIAAALFGTYLLTAQFAPIWNLVVVGVLLLVTPLIVVSGLRFRARYSAWRGLSFRFEGRVGEAYALFLGWMVPTLFTLGMLYPWVKWKQQAWLARRHAYGSERFGFDGELGPYYGAYAIAFVALIAVMVLFAFSVAGLTVAALASGADAGDSEQPGSVVLVVMYSAIALMYLGYFAIFVGLRTAITNLLWNHTQLGPHHFRSRLRIHQVVWIFLGNAIAIVASLGLLVPWAKIRMARYRAAHFELLAAGPLENFAADAREHYSAAGAEVGDAFDIDLSI